MLRRSVNMLTVPRYKIQNQWTRDGEIRHIPEVFFFLLTSDVTVIYMARIVVCVRDDILLLL